MDRLFTRIAGSTATAMGQPLAFMIATGLCVLWAVTGPIFHYSDTWQLVINTGTTVLTFLMVFLIQNSQNRDAGAMQAKLDELIRAVEQARGQFIGIEHLTDQQIELVRAAQEKHAKKISEEKDDKQETAPDTVDRLLDRF